MQGVCISFFRAIGNFLIKFTPKVSDRYVCIFCSLTRSLLSLSLASYLSLAYRFPASAIFTADVIRICLPNCLATCVLYTNNNNERVKKKKRRRRRWMRQDCDRHSHKSIYTCNTCIVRRRVRIEWVVSRVLLLTLPKFRWQIHSQTLTGTHTRHSWIPCTLRDALPNVKLCPSVTRISQ